MSRNERKQTSKQEIKKGRKKANKQERTQRKEIQDIRSNVAIPLEINKGTVAGRPKAIGYIYPPPCRRPKCVVLFCRSPLSPGILVSGHWVKGGVKNLFL